MNHSAVSVIEAPTRQVPPGAVVGDRFHPTDQELVDYYLRRYISASGYEGNELPIAEVNVYKVEPRDLPGLSKIVSDDQEWFFISPLEFMDKKRKRFNRKTKTGTWKPTGKPRKVLEKGSKKEIGSKRTLVFDEKNAKTEWVIHEYQYTVDSDLPNAGEFVIIKLKRKPDEKSKKRKLNCGFSGNCEDESQCESANSACRDGVFVSSEIGSHNHDAMSDLDEPSCGMASSCDIHSSVTESEEGRWSPPTTTFFLENQSLMIKSIPERPLPLEDQSSNSKSIPLNYDIQSSDYDTSEPSSRATSGCQNQSSVTEVRECGYFPYIPENHEENEQSNCLLASDFENQKLPSEIEDSSPKTTACTENQVTEDKTTPSCSATLKREGHFQNEDIDLSLLGDEDFLNTLIDFDVDNEANGTFPDVDPEVLTGEDAFRELKRSLNPGEQQ